MVKKRRFFPEGDIKTKYAKSGEFVIKESNHDFEGLYHILPDGTKWTEPKPSTKSEELTTKRFDVSERVQQYNLQKGETQKLTGIPTPHYPIPNSDDYNRGYINRYFLQKKNNPLNSIIEVSEQEYRSVSTNGTIDPTLWNKVTVKWKITSKHAGEMNENTLKKVLRQSNFKHLEKYLNNYFEFVK